MLNKVTLNQLIEQFEMISNDFSTYFQKSTQEFFVIPYDNFSIIENMDHIDDLSDYPSWQVESLIQTYNIVFNNQGDYIQLPDSYDLHEHQIMEDFSQTLSPPFKDQILEIIHKKGAYRNFKNYINYHTLDDYWYQFKRNALIELIKAWCKQNEVDYE